MKFKFIVLGLLSTIGFAQHVQDRSIYMTDIVAADGKTSLIKIPTSATTTDGVMVTNDNNEIQTLPGSSVNFTSGLMGLGVSPSVRLHVNDAGATLGPITSFTLTPVLETVLDNPTTTPQEVDGPGDMSGLSGTINLNTGSGTWTADGSDWSYTIYSQLDLSAGNIAGSFTNPTPQTFDMGFDDSSGNPITFSISWIPGSSPTTSPLITNTYYVIALNKNGSVVQNFLPPGGLGTSSYTIDNNNFGGSPASPFLNIAYQDPTGPAANPPNGPLTATQNFGESGWIDDGTCFDWQLDSYQTIGGQIYVSGSPIDSGSQCSGTSGNPYAWDLSAWTDGGNTQAFILRRTTDGGSTWTYQNIGYNFTYTDSGFGDDGSGVYWGHTWPGPGPITRHYDLYGYSLTPELYYSVTHSAFTATDSNPSGIGYVWYMPLTFGTTTHSKILGSTNGSGLTNGVDNVANTSFLDYLNVFSGSNIVTPQHVGFPGDGSTYTFHGYGKQNSPLLYSSSFDSVAQTLPNDGQYRYFQSTWSLPIGGNANKMLKDVNGGGFTSSLTVSGVSVNIYADTSFSGDTTVNPTSIPDTAAIFQNGAETKTDPAQIIVKTTASGIGVTDSEKIDFRNADNSVPLAIGYDGAAGVSYANMLSPNFDFQQSGSTYSKIYSSFSELNSQHNSNYTFSVFGTSTGTAFEVFSQYKSAAVGPSYGLGNYVFTINQGGGAIDLGIKAVSAQSVDLIEMTDVSGNKLAEFKGNGHLNLQNAGNDFGFIDFAGGTTNYAPMWFSSGTLNSTPRNGAFPEFDGTHFYATDTSSTRRIIALYSGVSPTSQALQSVDSTGHLVDSHIADTGTLLVHTLQSEFKSNISTDNGITANFGGAVTVPVGSAGGTLVVGGRLFSDFTDCNNSGSSATDCYSHNFNANGFSTNGQTLYADYAITTANNSNNKQIQIKFDTTTIYDTGTFNTAAASTHFIRATCTRDSATTARCIVQDMESGVVLANAVVQYTAMTVTNWTAIRVLKLTLTGTSSNDLTAKTGKVYYLP